MLNAKGEFMKHKFGSRLLSMLLAVATLFSLLVFPANAASDLFEAGRLQGRVRLQGVGSVSAGQAQ